MVKININEWIKDLEPSVSSDSYRIFRCPYCVGMIGLYNLDWLWKDGKNKGGIIEAEKLEDWPLIKNHLRNEHPFEWMMLNEGQI